MRRMHAHRSPQTHTGPRALFHTHTTHGAKGTPRTRACQRWPEPIHTPDSALSTRRWASRHTCVARGFRRQLSSVVPKLSGEANIPHFRSCARKACQTLCPEKSRRGSSPLTRMNVPSPIILMVSWERPTTHGFMVGPGITGGTTAKEYHTHNTC